MYAIRFGFGKDALWAGMFNKGTLTGGWGFMLRSDAAEFPTLQEAQRVLADRYDRSAARATIINLDLRCPECDSPIEGTFMGERRLDSRNRNPQWYQPCGCLVRRPPASKLH